MSSGRQETAAKIARIREARAAEALALQSGTQEAKPAVPKVHVKPEYAEAEKGVPHTHFARTATGFQVTYTRSPKSFLFLMVAVGGLSLLISVIGLISLLIPTIWGILAVINPLVLFLVFRALRPTTTITVDCDSVTVNDKKMSRDDFGNFHVFGSNEVTIEKKVTRFCELGYQFGRRSYPISGVWTEREVEEVASALNKELNRTPMSGDEHSPTPEELRVARPTDF